MNVPSSRGARAGGRVESMKYLLAILLPPLAVLLCGKPFQAVINLILTLMLWVPGVIHALFVVHSYENWRNTDRIIAAIERQRAG